MPSNTYIPLATYTVTGSNLDGPTGVTLTLPPASDGYTDIVIRANIKSTAAAIILGRFNGDAGSNYSSIQMGNGPSSSNGTSASQMYFSSFAHATTNWGSHTYNIFNYANSTTRKVVLARGSNSTYGVDQISGSWNASPTPITSVKIFLDRAENFVVGSTFQVYGIAAAAPAPKARGGAIFTDAEYYYHVFGATGTFTPTQSLTCDYLIVAGGGGGGGQQGGGGGAGGVRAFTGASLTTTNYTATVGAGGAGGVGQYNTSAGNGATTSFNSTSVTGGGHGAANGNNNSDADAESGGSGGGGGINNALSGSGNSGGYSPVEGYAGGTGGSGLNGGGGGGGAGGAGTSVTDGGITGRGANGGIGTYQYNSINFMNWLIATGVGTYNNGNSYIGGGGGGGYASSIGIAGLGGYGGGGNGTVEETTTTPSYANGIVGTGGGGGGGAQANGNGVGGKGGSGVVIVRYQK